MPCGWWRTGGALDKTFPLNDSQFAQAIKDWLFLKQRREAKGIVGRPVATLRAVNGKGENSPDTAWRNVTVGGQPLPSLHQHPPMDGSGSRIDFRLAMPQLKPGQKLLFVSDTGIKDSDIASDGVVFRLEVNSQPGYQSLTRQDGRWHPVQVDLSQFAGQSIVLSLRTQMNQNSIADAAAWGDPQVLVVASPATDHR